MAWLNYHHLLYFWTVAREGGVTRAAERLHLSPSAVSGQIKLLEKNFGAPLLARDGRRVVPTETGRIVLGYADEIFGLGRELQDVVRTGRTSERARLRVGIADVVPKLVAYALLAPALELDPPVSLVCSEAPPARLVAALAAHELDLVISDAPLPENARIKTYSHLLGECDLTFLAAKALASTLRGRFPRSLDGAPVLAPAAHSALRLALDAWWEELGVAPRIVGEFEDSALLDVFGAEGRGAFAVPSAIEAHVRARHHVYVVGRVPDIKARFYAISPERKIRQPAVLAITRQARRELFA